MTSMLVLVPLAKQSQPSHDILGKMVSNNNLHREDAFWTMIDYNSTLFSVVVEKEWGVFVPSSSIVRQEWYQGISLHAFYSNLRQAMA
jgi:hypothetical protein